ncbi:Myb/SANT-like DNA-binding domain-containing protein [Phanerochaete sordida]|uniref:Myb/SANT-like DNA-binding domain-containing protein n=1 Tax=Phanerochaete sordida TaxID=48140 RepID=A0A9P3GMW6_9APHY|nr:Myb/SANT-like DNA-binding domain-containing protein [Phanerochaete sordida]
MAAPRSPDVLAASGTLVLYPLERLGEISPAPEPVPPSSRRTRNANWAPEEDEVLTDILVEALRNGTSFVKISEYDPVWKQAAETLNARVAHRRGGLKTGRKCYDRFAKLRRDRVEFESLKDQADMHWDDEKKMLVAPDEKWEELAKIDARCRRWQDNPWPLYEKMRKLCPQTPARRKSTGGQSNAPTSALPRKRPSNAGLKGSPAKRQRQETAKKTSAAEKAREPVLIPGPTKTGSTATATTPALTASSDCKNPKDKQLPERREAAVRLLESDGEYTAQDQVAIVEMFERRPDVMTTFLSFSEKDIRTLYIRRALSQYRWQPSRSVSVSLAAFATLAVLHYFM